VNQALAVQLAELGIVPLLVQAAAAGTWGSGASADGARALWQISNARCSTGAPPIGIQVEPRWKRADLQHTRLCGALPPEKACLPGMGASSVQSPQGAAARLRPLWAAAPAPGSDPQTARGADGQANPPCRVLHLRVAAGLPAQQGQGGAPGGGAGRGKRRGLPRRYVPDAAAGEAGVIRAGAVHKL